MESAVRAQTTRIGPKLGPIAGLENPPSAAQPRKYSGPPVDYYYLSLALYFENKYKYKDWIKYDNIFTPKASI